MVVDVVFCGEADAVRPTSVRAAAKASRADALVGDPYASRHFTLASLTHHLQSETPLTSVIPYTRGQDVTFNT